MNGFLISIITALGGVITAWISSTVVWKQKEIGIIDRLSYELEVVKNLLLSQKLVYPGCLDVVPYSIQFCSDCLGNDSNLLVVFYVQIMSDDFVMQFHRF